MKLADIHLGEVLRLLEAKLPTCEVGIEAASDTIRAEAVLGRRRGVAVIDLRRLPQSTSDDVAERLAELLRLHLD